MSYALPQPPTVRLDPFRDDIWPQTHTEQAKKMSVAPITLNSLTRIPLSPMTPQQIRERAYKNSPVNQKASVVSTAVLCTLKPVSQLGICRCTHRSTGSGIQKSDSKVVGINRQEEQKNFQAERDAKEKPSQLGKFSAGKISLLSFNGKAISVTSQQYQIVMKQALYLQSNSKESLSKQGEFIEAAGGKFYAKLQNGKFTVIKIIDFIDSGSNGYVCKVVDLVSGIFAALKIAKNGKLIHKLQNEVAILKYIHASGVKPGIQPVPLVEFDIPNRLTGFVSPLYNLDLFTRIVENPNLSFQNKKNYINQLLQAIKVLREVGVWHADVKLENIWVTDDDKLLIGDFDGAVTFADVASKGITPKSRTGTNSQADWVILLQALKENFLKLKEIALAMDLYSIYVCIFMIITGYPPYNPAKFGEIPCFSSDANVIFTKPVLSTYSSTVTNFLARMMDHDHTKRPSLQESTKFWSELAESIALPSALNCEGSKNL